MARICGGDGVGSWGSVEGTGRREGARGGGRELVTAHPHIVYHLCARVQQLNSLMRKKGLYNCLLHTLTTNNILS